MRMRNIKVAAFRRYAKSGLDPLFSLTAKGLEERFWVKVEINLNPELRRPLLGGARWELELELEPRDGWVEALVVTERETVILKKTTVSLEDFEREALVEAFLNDRVLGQQGLRGYVALVRRVEELEEKYFGGSPNGDPEEVEVSNLATIKSISQSSL